MLQCPHIILLTAFAGSYSIFKFKVSNSLRGIYCGTLQLHWGSDCSNVAATEQTCPPRSPAFTTSTKDTSDPYSPPPLFLRPQQAGKFLLTHRRGQASTSPLHHYIVRSEHSYVIPHRSQLFFFLTSWKCFLMGLSLIDSMQWKAEYISEWTVLYYPL